MAILVLLLITLPLFAAEHSIQVLVSFSLPEQLFKEVLADSARLKIPAVLNGLYNNSMPETLTKILALTKEVPDLNLQIDPTAFERFAVRQVPALIVEGEKNFDVLYGNLALKKGLERIAESGDSGLTIAEIKVLTGE